MKLAHTTVIALCLTACAHVEAPREEIASRPDTPPVVADHGEPEPPPPNPEPALKQVRATLDVWGGDGDGLPAVWTLIVRVVVENHGQAPLTVRSARWDVDALGLEAEDGAERVVPASGSVELEGRTRIPLATLRAVRERQTLPVRWTMRWSRDGEERRSTVSVDARLGVERRGVEGRPPR